MVLEQEQPVERFHPDDEVNDILVTAKRGMNVDPTKYSLDYIKRLENFVAEQREKRENQAQALML